jgi:hypothetical protein
MKPTSPRKITILDAMILIAASACGLALSRTMEGPWEDIAFYASNWLGRLTNDPVRVGAALPFLMTFTPAVLLIRLRQPRPRLRRLLRQPGMVACTAAMVPIVLALLQLSYLEWGPRPRSPYGIDWARRPLFWDCGFDGGIWVLGAWLALALSGRRRAEPSRIDRLGKLVGASWLIVAAIWVLGTA